MDASFDAFGAGGWGADGDEFNTQMRRVNAYEKSPLQVAIPDLISSLESGDDNEKFRIGTYAFNTIRVIGKIANVTTDANQTTTYELCEHSKDLRTSKRFTVIRYEGAESNQNDSAKVYPLGTTVHAIGKLRSFNNRLSLVSFGIREVSSSDEIEVFELDAKLAKIYYTKGIPELTDIEQYAATVFCPGTIRHEKGGGDGQKQHQQQYGNAYAHGIQQSQARQQVGMMSMMNNKNSNNNYNTGPSHNQSPAPSANLNQQQLKIFDYIRQFAKSESGVPLESIRQAIRPDARLLDDINHLLSEGMIYSTIDDEHFSAI